VSYGDTPPPPPPPQYGAPMPGAVPGTNRKAIWSLVTGILGLLCCGLLGIAAIVLGQGAKREIAASGEGGGGMATAGVVLGIIGLVWMVISIILAATGNFYYSFNTN
jgi:Domain of unknown function (DUF4190)